MRIAIIGNGAAAISGIEAFRKYDSKNPITLVSPEKSPPYSRVLLPYLLQGRIEHKDIYYRSPRLYDQLNIQTFLGHSVVEVDAVHKRLHLDSGERIPFDKLLIASGSSPVKPPIPGSNGSDIGHLWTIGDAIRIEKEFREKKRLLIIGGGFISLMLAWVAHERGIEVTIIELMPHVMPQTLDQDAAEILETEIQKTGTRLLTGTVVESIQKRSEGTYNIYPANQPSFPVDMVIVAAGASPNLGFVDPDLIEVDRGIVVNDRMETSVPDIYAAGDVAQGPSAFGGPHIVQALWTTAVEHGQIAGVNMAGEEVHYQGGLGNNVSEFFHVTVASIGLLEESEHVTARESVDSKRETYLKLFLDGNVPVGGMMLGSPEDVSSFGVLKSYILRRRDLSDMKTLVASTIRPVCRSASTADADTLMQHRVAQS